jgi:signal transduction histidine kinase
MTRRLVASYVALTAVALALLAIPLGITFSHNERGRFLSEMEADADTMASLVAYPIDSGKPIPSQDIARYALSTNAHVVVVDEDGIALLDTNGPSHGRDYSTRPEIQQALRGQRVEGRRRSDTAGTTLLYAAVPTSAKGRVNGAVRITYPTSTLDGRVRRVWFQLALLCLGVLAVAALAGMALARSIVRPVRQLETATDRFASGDLTAQVDEEHGPPEMRQLAATFNRMARRHAQLLGAQQRFVADASHQLRTPLTALRLRLDNLDARVGDHDGGAVGAAVAEVNRMSRIIDGLLLLARDEADDRVKQPVDLAAAVRERADAWNDVAGDRGIVVRATASSPAWVEVVPGTVEQVVDNLVDNAITASPDESVIELRVGVRARTVTLQVLDRGPGMDAATRARAFDRFWRAPAAPAGGSGLGLAIVRQLAEAHGGEARLDPRPGGGLVAAVTLPLASGDRAGAGREPTFTSR